MVAKQWQQEVVDYGKAHGWLVHSSDNGFPDLVLAREGVVLLVALKSQNGVLSKAQRQWWAASGYQMRVWRPSDRGEAEVTLR